jgi:mono/diheme cytochrome c family protein
MRALVLASLLFGCTATTAEVRPLTVYPVEWNTQKVPLGKVAALAESGDELTVFGSLGAVTFAGGAPVATDDSIREWRAAATIPAADGAGSWMVGLDAHGHLHRVRARSTLEPISARFGLENQDVRALGDLGRGRVAFVFASGVAIADGDRVARFDYSFSAITGGDGRGAGITATGARVFDPFRGVDRAFALAGLRYIALGEGGRVVVADERAIWSEDDKGRLVLRYRSEANTIHGLAASAENIWFADGGELGLLSAAGPARTTGMTSRAATILGSPSGDVWTIDEGHKLSRFSTVRAADLWQTAIAPIQSRVCGGCHGPSGSAGLDLSGAARWQANRRAIERRVIKEKTMPPPGHALTTDERDAIAKWVAAP